MGAKWFWASIFLQFSCVYFLLGESELQNEVNLHDGANPSRKMLIGNSEPYVPEGISFHGGPVMDTGLNVYIIWYGRWSSLQKEIIVNFINSMGTENVNSQGSVREWWMVNGLYYNSQGQSLSTEVTLKNQVDDHYSYGKGYLEVDMTTNIVSNHLKRNHLPKDQNGVYLLLTSDDVLVTNVCFFTCAYRKTFRLKHVRYPLRYAVIGNTALTCPQYCTTYTEPNGDLGVDGMTNQIITQMASMATNPEHTAWFDHFLVDNGNKCISANISYYSGAQGSYYSLQPNWNPVTGECYPFGKYA